MTYYDSLGRPLRLPAEPDPTPGGDELAVPDAADTTYPVDTWTCALCDADIGWVTLHGTDDIDLAWITTFEMPNAALWCEDCAYTWHEHVA
jgi:hypothetical protein